MRRFRSTCRWSPTWCIAPATSARRSACAILSGNICGLLAPIITGYVVAGLGAYDWAFGIAGILLIIGALALATMTRHVILPRAEAVPV